jgi:hypothetical protein
VAAILIRRDLDPVTVVQNTKKTLASFKAHRLQRSGLRPLLAALVLVLDANGGVPHRARVARMQAIIVRWKKDHRWLTGTDDYPMAALHATRDADVELIGLEVEEIYQQLKRERFRAGEQLQLASHLLAFSGLGPQEATLRFQRVASELRRCGQRIGTRHYDELALLAVSGLSARDAVARVIEYRDRLRAVRPRPAADIALSIAAGVVLAAAADEAGEIEDAAEAAGLRAVQAMIEAQQAAMVASIAAVSAATTVAAS